MEAAVSRGEYCSCPTVAITGPIGATADDLAVGYLAIGDHSAPGMPVHIPRNYFGFDVSDLRIGVIRAYNAQVFNPAITAALTRVEDELVKRGATVVDISFPYLELVRQAHVITISSELYSAITSDPNSQQMQFGTVALCSAFRHLSVKDYIHAQKLRTHAIHVLRNVFSRVDFLMSPTAAVTAPAFPRDTWAGISDTTLVTDIMRFSFLANFAGTPAVTCPVGLDDSGLPVAVQFMGEWWSEGRLCALAKWMEGEFASLNEARAPGWDGVGF
ncbi:amidase signature domain-containing protein [Chytriomyces sp. MP71]|nr:amidase signature domain-containing protein [Chytriomyces sp. MP71]